MNILGKSNVTYKQLETFIKSVKTANKLMLKNLPIMWKVANDRGILVELFVSQIIVETGYMNFGGVLDASFHNTCGLKTTKGGSNYSANAHMRFKSWEEGINAHADHLALYAGAKGFPRYSPNCASHPNENYKSNGTTLDPRHFPYLYGKCKTVESLEGNWATSKGYANKLKTVMKQIQNTKVNENKVEEKKEETTKVNGKYKNGTYNRKGKVTASSLNIRKGRPGTSGYKTIMGHYKKGTVVTVHYCLNGWFGVIYNGKQGYVSGDYIELL
jgi:N-acetylmuramoyl-L-alanine amidase